jgi:hypothetical protein
VIGIKRKERDIIAKVISSNINNRRLAEYLAKEYIKNIERYEKKTMCQS